MPCSLILFISKLSEVQSRVMNTVTAESIHGIIKLAKHLHKQTRKWWMIWRTWWIKVFFRAEAERSAICSIKYSGIILIMKSFFSSLIFTLEIKINGRFQNVIWKHVQKHLKMFLGLHDPTHTQDVPSLKSWFITATVSASGSHSCPSVCAAGLGISQCFSWSTQSYRWSTTPRLY